MEDPRLLVGKPGLSVEKFEMSVKNLEYLSIGHLARHNRS